MVSPTPRTEHPRPEPAPQPRAAQSAPVPPVPMRALLAACRAAEAVSTPPEHKAA